MADVNLSSFGIRKMISLRAALFVALVSVLFYTFDPSYPTLSRVSRAPAPQQDPSDLDIPRGNTTLSNGTLSNSTEPPQRFNPSRERPSPAPSPAPSDSDASNNPVSWLILFAIVLVLATILSIIIYTCKFANSIHVVNPLAAFIEDREPDEEWTADPVPRYKNKGSPESISTLPDYETVEDGGDGAVLDRPSTRSTVFMSRSELFDLARRNS
jgi:hypothetical protein